VKVLSDHVRRRLREAVGVGEEPGRVAAAWAVGVGIGLSPLFGLHTAIALGIAFLFRLNKLDVLIGTLIINPWTMTLYFPSAVMLGRFVTGIRVPRIVLPHLEDLFVLAAWREQTSWMKPLLVAWAVGALLVAFVVGFTTYWVVRGMVVTHRRRHAARAGAVQLDR
jgi:uncharacterized protein